ncbi:hypothetical protein Ga0100230_015430 [Opitutaceae bacterium TAV3]|nr:hypothetical protein Ga0100230_015430 [Opitutaceae bacterium TAV3]
MRKGKSKICAVRPTQASRRAAGGGGGGGGGTGGKGWIWRGSAWERRHRAGIVLMAKWRGRPARIGTECGRDARATFDADPTTFRVVCRQDAGGPRR